MAIATTGQTVVLSPLPPVGTRIANWPGGGRLHGPPSRSRHFEVRSFEAVGDVEITDSVELSTEPGVMGRIGPLFPRSASFRLRLHGTGNSNEAVADHAYLKSLIGKLLYIDARASPAEKITWTLENVKAVDDNSAVNAFDVDVTAREIIGGEFGDFFPVDKLETSLGLVPVELVQDPNILGVGDQNLTLTMREAPLRTASSAVAAGTIQQRQVAALEIFVRGNENAIAQVTADKVAAGRTLDILRGQLEDNINHINIFGAPLPQIQNCTKATLNFVLYGKSFKIDIDATQNVTLIKLSADDRIHTMQPLTPTFVPNLFQETVPVQSQRKQRGAIEYPENRDAIFILHSHKADRFTVENFPQYTLLVFVVADVA